VTATGSSISTGTDLDWLRAVLWADPDVHVSFDDVPPAGHRHLLTYGVVPSARRPRLLVPMHAAGARRGAFWQFNDGMTRRARMTKSAAGVAAALAGRVAIRDRIHLHVVVGRSLDDLADVLPEAMLAAALGRDEVAVAITFGSPRPNRKPVLEAMERDGTPLGYMKVAWNDLTERLVANEADVLRRWAEAPPATFRVPRLALDGRWRERRIAVTHAFRHSIARHAPLDALPEPNVLHEVASRGGVGTRSVSSLELWHAIRESLSRSGSDGDGMVALATRFDETFGDLELAAGAWHGDLAPWNMSRTRRGLTIWDWERSRSGVPVGLDLVHFTIQLGIHRSRLDVAAAARRAAADVGRPRSAMGVAEEAWRAIVPLYLFELYRRYLDGMRQDVLGAEAQMLRAIAAAIESAVKSP
jgi:hypothetical protein